MEERREEKDLTQAILEYELRYCQEILLVEVTKEFSHQIVKEIVLGMAEGHLRTRYRLCCSLSLTNSHTHSLSLVLCVSLFSVSVLVLVTVSLSPVKSESNPLVNIIRDIYEEIVDEFSLTVAREVNRIRVTSFSFFPSSECE